MIPPSVTEDCRKAAALLDRAKDEEPERLKEHLREAQRLTVGARDALIHALRTTTGDANADRRQALDHVNASLSLMVGTEYPIAGLHRKALEHAHHLLLAAGR